jgi:hypothetical protein
MAPAAARAPSERRATARIPTSLRGKTFPGAVDCVIADFSKLGARLRFDAKPPEGQSLIVVVWSSGQAFDADVRWRAGDEVGVRFSGSRDLRRPAPPHLEEAQALWTKRRRKLPRRVLAANPAIVRTERPPPPRMRLVPPD